jgi:hypothetical protein
MRKVGNLDAILAIVDRATRYVRIISCAHTWKTNKTILAIERAWIATFGYPRSITSDNGGVFSNEWNQHWARNGVNVKKSSAYHPQANGLVESQFRTIPSLCRIYKAEMGGEWPEAIPHVELVRNATPSRALGGLSPSEVMLGYMPRNHNLPGFPELGDAPLKDQLAESARLLHQARRAMQTYSERMRIESNTTRAPFVAAAGDYAWVAAKVLLKESKHGLSKLSDRYFGPYRIEEALSDTTFRLALPQPKRGHRTGIVHASLLRPARPPKEMEGKKIFHPPKGGRDQTKGIRSPSRSRSPRIPAEPKNPGKDNEGRKSAEKSSQKTPRREKTNEEIPAANPQRTSPGTDPEPKPKEPEQGKRAGEATQREPEKPPEQKEPERGKQVGETPEKRLEGPGPGSGKPAKKPDDREKQPRARGNIFDEIRRRDTDIRLREEVARNERAARRALL